MIPDPGGGPPVGTPRELRIFISSATGALRPYRQTAVDVCHRLGYRPVFMEDFDPQRPPPGHVCRAKLESCDVLVLLLAHRYGSKPPGQDTSFTELEYRWAARRDGMQLLAFVVDSDYPWPLRDVDQGPDAAALARLITEVKTGHLVRPLADMAVFREDLMIALSREQLAVPAAAPAEADADAEEPRQLPRPPAFHAVPAYMGGAPFTGRLSHLAALDRWGQSADPVLVVEAIGGTGKSALTWQWAQERAPAVIDGLAGRLWWSFYEGSASMTRFLRELLAYTTARPMKQIRQLERSNLVDQVLAELRRGPYLVVLDGFERMLAAYHQFDPSKLRDEEVEPDKRSMIEPNAEEIVRQLTTAGPSKILFSTRLMPRALNSRFGSLMPGVRHVRLPGLSDADTRTLLERLGVTGSEVAITRFLGPLDNHPLLVGIVAGLVRDYRAGPGGFDRWLTDPTAGGALSVPALDLTQRRTHILAAALAGLSPGSQQLLGWISELPGLVTWDTLAAINPFRPEPPDPVEPDLSSLGPEPYPPNPFDYGYPRSASEWPRLISYDGPETDRTEQKSDEEGDEYLLQQGRWHAAADRAVAQARQETREQLATWSESEPVRRARAQLDAALKDLEDRGLLWWDRSSNCYDLHPIIRANAHDQLGEADRVLANDRIKDHFQSLPPEEIDRAASVEDLARTIVIFRALVGAGHLDEAALLWRQFGNPLFVGIGAYNTIVELLSPLALCGPLGLRADLTIAYVFLGQYDEAISQEVKILNDVLEDEDINNLETSLARLAVAYWNSGAYIATDRCLCLCEALVSALGEEPTGTLVVDRAAQAAMQGQMEQARELIRQAEYLDSGYNRWFEDDILRWDFYLALHADRSLTQDQLSAAADSARSWQLRHEVAELRRRLHIRDGRFEHALAASEEHDRLGRDAGLEVIQATTAFLLAKLGRSAEATAAVEEALIRLPRIYPSKRPHYDLARAMQELGRHAEAAGHGRQAYRNAWGEGAPNYLYWDLQDARGLLDALSEPAPDLPVVDAASITIPFEHEIRALIATIKAERQGNSETGP